MWKGNYSTTNLAPRSKGWNLTHTSVVGGWCRGTAQSGAEKPIIWRFHGVEHMPAEIICVFTAFYGLFSGLSTQKTLVVYLIIFTNNLGKFFTHFQSSPPDVPGLRLLVIDFGELLRLSVLNSPGGVCSAFSSGDVHQLMKSKRRQKYA